MKYEIKGDPFPVVIFDMEAGEKVNCEGGAMVWMTSNMEMETQGGGLGKVFGRLVSGENLFQNTYTCNGGKGMIAFGSNFMGSIKVVEVTPDKPVVAQKSAFVAATTGVEMSIFFQKKLGAGFFGGEGFIMEKFTGNGLVFLEIDGYEQAYDLASGEEMIVSTGNLAVCDASVSIDIKSVKGVKNALFGGEGLFNTVVRGPGRIILQTQTIPTVASALSAYIATSSSN